MPFLRLGNGYNVLKKTNYNTTDIFLMHSFITERDNFSLFARITYDLMNVRHC